MRVCIGGTFDILHRGHKLLISKAFETAGKQGYVFIGVTTGEIINKKGDVESFEKRKRAIEQYLSEKKSTARFLIKPIHDKYGPSLEEEFDAIVVSNETRPNAEEINRIRKNSGKKPLEIIQIPFVLAEDDIPISSSRIRKNMIDSDGRVLKRD